MSLSIFTEFDNIKTAATQDKLLEDLKNGDTIYLVDLKTFDITTAEVENIEREERIITQPEFIVKQENEKEEFKYNVVAFDYKISENLSAHTYSRYGTLSYFMNSSNDFVICTSNRIATFIVELLTNLCSVQASMLMKVFHGQLIKSPNSNILYR